MSERLRVVGDSHAAQPIKPWSNDPAIEVATIGPAKFIAKIVDDGAIADAYAPQFAGDHDIALLLGNDCYNVFCVVLGGLDAAPEFRLATVPGDMSEGPILSEEMIRATMAPQMATIGEIAKVSGAKLIVAGPPPTRDEDAIRAAFARKGINKVWIADAPTRARCYRIQTEMLADVARECGVIFVPPLAEAIDEEGLLRAEYVHDGVHGNRPYSSGLMASILRHWRGEAE